MKKVMITGGAGFIGSHLVDACVKRGFQVSVIDNLSVGRRDNIAEHIKSGRVEFHEVDVADYERVIPLFEGVDWVFHLAARADIVPSIQMPMTYHKANVDGTMNVLEASRTHRAKRFVYAASSSCYGLAKINPTPESAEISPQYPYALTKYLGECQVLHWGQVYKMPVVSLRFFNVYGPRARTSGTYGAVFGVFLAQKINNKPFTVVGDGTQTRDFTFVYDIVSALLTAAESNVQSEVFNVGSGGTYSINSLVKQLGGEVTYIPKRPGEPDCTYADISKIKKTLNWTPEIAFEDGVKLLMRDINLWKNAPVWSPESIAGATQDWFKYLAE